MTTKSIINPSSLVSKGIQISQVDNLNLFKFTDELQSRMEELLEKKKADLLTPEELAELAAILELDRIFTLINAKVIAQA